MRLSCFSTGTSLLITQYPNQNKRIILNVTTNQTHPVSMCVSGGSPFKRNLKKPHENPKNIIVIIIDLPLGGHRYNPTNSLPKNPPLVNKKLKIFLRKNLGRFGL